MKSTSGSLRISRACAWVAAAACGQACGGTGGGAAEAPELSATSKQAVTSAYDWLQFNGDARHSGNNTQETQIGPANVSKLTKLFTVPVPNGISADSAVSILTTVTIGTATHNLAFLETSDARVVAFDAQSGGVIWQNPLPRAPGFGANATQSTPAVDPNRKFVYAADINGAIHKLNVADGTDVPRGNGWPEVLSLKPMAERPSSALTLATAQSGKSYLYMGTGGYGDQGDYQGHIVAIDLASGAQQVFNALCSNQAVHFSTNPDCTQTTPCNTQFQGQAAVWARSGVVYDSDTDKVYFATGNGPFDPSTHRWSDSILALKPDGTGSITGDPIDSYTPTTVRNLECQDLDLGSSAPQILPKGTTAFPHIAVQVGKDSTLRIVNLDHLGGSVANAELFSMALPTGGEVQNALATWTDSTGTVWVFVVSPTNGLSALTLGQDGSGKPLLISKWKITATSGSSPLVANGVLYWATNNMIRAIDLTSSATTPNVVWTDTSIGAIHWQTPVVANGVLYIADSGAHLSAFSLVSNPPPAFPVQINFQTASAPPFSGYLEDTGLAFGNRGNGWSYGWNVDISSSARQRNSTLSPDERYDTLVQPQRGGLNASWDLAVPSGTYSVRIVAGDPSYIDSKYVIAAEGTVVINGTPTASTHWFDNTVTVPVTDGNLTITNASGSSNNKIDFVVVNKL